MKIYITRNILRNGGWIEEVDDAYPHEDGGMAVYYDDDFTDHSGIRRVYLEGEYHLDKQDAILYAQKMIQERIQELKAELADVFALTIKIPWKV